MDCPRRYTCWKSRLYWEEMPGRRATGKGNPGGPLCHVGRSLRFYGDGISFQVVSGQSFGLRVLPGGACHRSAKMDAREGDPGCWYDIQSGVSFWPFANSSGGCWLVSSMFLTRTACLKITPANGCYGPWPGWAVSVFPLTKQLALPSHQGGLPSVSAVIVRPPSQTARKRWKARFA